MMDVAVSRVWWAFAERWEITSSEPLESYLSILVGAELGYQDRRFFSRQLVAALPALHFVVGADNLVTLDPSRQEPGCSLTGLQGSPARPGSHVQGVNP